MRRSISALPVGLALALAACGSTSDTVPGIKFLTIQEAKTSANGTWKRPCVSTDTGVEQLVLQFSGSDTLISTQDYDAPATQCSGTPSAVDNITGTSKIQADPKVVTWIADAAPVGLPDALYATQIVLSLDKAIGKTKELKLIAVIDNEQSPDLLYLSGSKDDSVTLDKSGFPNELNPDPYTRD